MVRKEQKLRTDEEMVREYLATFSEFKFGETSQSHSRLLRELRQFILNFF